MITTPIKTRIFKPPQDDLPAVIKDTLPKIEEKSVLVITSKVVSIWEGRCVPKANVQNKDALIIQEADKYLSRDQVPGEWVMHTVKNNLFIPSAGVDESNSGDYYVLWPKHPKKSARTLYDWVRETYSIKDVGIIISDSHTIPLRRGVLGISLSYAGFKPLHDYRGKNDLFGRALKMTQTDIVDGLAASAVLLMGEGNESTPLALITDVPFVTFESDAAKTETPESSLEIPEQEDLYYPLLSSVAWKQGGGYIKKD